MYSPQPFFNEACHRVDVRLGMADSSPCAIGCYTTPWPQNRIEWLPTPLALRLLCLHILVRDSRSLCPRLINCGSAYIFRLEFGAWQQEAQLLPGTIAQGAHFGQAVQASVPPQRAAVATDGAQILPSTCGVLNLPHFTNMYVCRSLPIPIGLRVRCNFVG